MTKYLEGQVFDQFKKQFFQLCKRAKSLTHYEVVTVFITHQDDSGVVFTDENGNYFLYPYDELMNDIHSFFGDSHRQRTADKPLLEKTIGKLVAYYRNLKNQFRLYLTIVIDYPFNRLESIERPNLWIEEKEEIHV